MAPEDVKKLQALLDSKTNPGVNLDLNPTTGKLTWGCVHCGTAPVLLEDKCTGGSFFPGNRCKERKNFDD